MIEQRKFFLLNVLTFLKGNSLGEKVALVKCNNAASTACSWSVTINV